MTDNDLLGQQEELQREGAAVEEDLGLVQRLSVLGRPVRVGSAALGVMVRRDLDITTTCAALDPATHRAVADLGAALVLHPRVRQVHIRDDTGTWNTDPAYPDGLYLGVQYRCARARDWTLDLWFVDDPDRQPDLAHLRDLLPLLDTERRVSILTIKHERFSRPEHRATTCSYDVYRAVLEGGVHTPEQFDHWLDTTANR